MEAFFFVTLFALAFSHNNHGHGGHHGHHGDRPCPIQSTSWEQVLAFDLNQDGLLDLVEFRNFLQASGEHRERHQTAEERAEKYFKHADQNDDGFLDQSEYEALQEKITEKTWHKMCPLLKATWDDVVVFDVDADSLLDLEEFTVWMLSIKGQREEHHHFWDKVYEGIEDEDDKDKEEDEDDEDDEWIAKSFYYMDHNGDGFYDREEFESTQEFIRMWKKAFWPVAIILLVASCSLCAMCGMCCYRCQKRKTEKNGHIRLEDVEGQVHIPSALDMKMNTSLEDKKEATH